MLIYKNGDTLQQHIVSHDNKRDGKEGSLDRGMMKSSKSYGTTGEESDDSKSCLNLTRAAAQPSTGSEDKASILVELANSLILVHDSEVRVKEHSSSQAQAHIRKNDDSTKLSVRRY